MILLFTGSAGFKSSRFALHAASWLWIGSLFMLVPQMMHALLRVKMLYVLRVPLHFFTWLANPNGCSVSALGTHFHAQSHRPLDSSIRS